MKTLSIRQPWAWAVVAGHKTVENRSWPTAFRGRILVHAGLSRADLFDQLPDGTPVEHDQLAFGAVIGSVEIVDCVPVAQVAGDPFASGPWCFVLASPVRFAEPFPCKGKLGFFEVELPADVSPPKTPSALPPSPPA